MNRTVIIFVLLAFIGFVCAAGTLYVGHSVEHLNGTMEQTIELSKSGNFDKANQKLLETERLWKQHRKILMMYIDQDLLDEMDNQLVLLKALMQYHQEEFLPQAMLCLSHLEEIQQRESVTMRSWF